MEIAGAFDTFLNILGILIKMAVVIAIVMLHVAYATWFERKIIAHMQIRLGPMEVGWHGLLQPIADGVKLLFKEDIIPAKADRYVFMIAPLICFFAAMSSVVVVPFFGSFTLGPFEVSGVLANINIGILFILAMSSLGAYGVIMAGWASNSKYAFLGGLRSSAQVISYEIAMGLSLVGVMMLSGSMNLTTIVEAQAATGYKWYVVPQFIAFAVFCVSALAETNRTPFDLPEAESELVAGYFTEYSGFRFALFFLAEYLGMIIMASFGTICFLGGWQPVPGLGWLLPSGVWWFLVKVYALFFMYVWVRTTLPRYRYDQLMALGWKFLIPLALFNIFATGMWKVLFP